MLNYNEEIAVLILTDTGDLKKDINKKTKMKVSSLQKLFSRLQKKGMVVFDNQNRSVSITENNQLYNLELLDTNLTWKDLI